MSDTSENPNPGALAIDEGTNLFNFEAPLGEYLNFLTQTKDLAIGAYSVTGDNTEYSVKGWLAWLLGSKEDPISEKLKKYGLIALLIAVPVFLVKVLFGKRK